MSLSSLFAVVLAMAPRWATRLLLGILPLRRIRASLSNGSVAESQESQGVTQLLVDVSVIARDDARTGIQRVVRNLYSALLACAPAGCIVRPVAATRARSYHYLPADFLSQAHNNGCAFLEPVRMGAGDVFLALDLCAHILPVRTSDLARWKRDGARIYFVVYDLLPVHRPEWFPKTTGGNFSRWLLCIGALADGVIAISNTVKQDVEQWFEQKHRIGKRDLVCTSIKLGAGFDSVFDDKTSVPLELALKGFVLMVGTLEPRKGHAVAIDAFEHVWKAGNPTCLVIVGKRGWMVERLVERLHTHPEFGQRLFWIEASCDQTLRALYHACNGVLMASEGEGFGLPLTEAASYGKPILARDIPVFREIGGGHVTYFVSDSGKALGVEIVDWMRAIAGGTAPSSRGIPLAPWSESAAQVIGCVLNSARN